MVDDIHRLAAINTFFAESPQAAVSAASRGYRAVRGREQYRRVPYALVAPAHPGRLGELAGEVLRTHIRGWRALTDPDYAVLSLLLGRGQASAAEKLEMARAAADVRLRRMAAERDQFREILAGLADPVIAINDRCPTSPAA